MKLDILEEVVIDQIENLSKKETGLIRHVDTDKILTTKQITVISGIRRSGKSTLLWQLMQHFDDYYYLNFDDERLINFTVEDFRELMIIFKKQHDASIVFFDEIQNVEGWERFARRLFDENYKIFITGSNSKLLSSELATHLTGRYIKIELFPFSFSEFIEYNNINIKKLSSDTKSKILKCLDRYLNKGGFPEYLKYNDDEFIVRVYEDVIYKDLIARFKIRNINQFKKLSHYLFSNFTGEISYNSLKTILAIKSANTISEYISALQEAYLLFELYKFEFSLKKQYTSAKKIYVIDTGIRNKVSFRFSHDKGKLLENIVFIQLRRMDKNLFYYKTKTNKKVDFMYAENNTHHLFQVAWDITDVKTKEREIQSLIEASEEIENTCLYIITYNVEDKLSIENKTVRIIPVWKWMLHIEVKI